jgi:hypothetical protein
MSYKNKIIIFCKSFSRDVDRVCVLFDSIKKHNKDNIPFYLVIPREDVALFQSKLGSDGYNIVLEEEINSEIKVNTHFTQQLFKMEFYKTQVAEYFFLVDSDMYFIKDFYVNSFLTEDGIPYMTMHECKDFLEYSDIIFGDNRLNEWFQSERLAIMELFGRKGKLYDYSGSANLYASEVFRGLYENYCKPNNLQFLDLLKYCASENTWYGEYALYSDFKFYPCAPMFKTFHLEWQYKLAKQLGVTESSISRNYIGITMQSNWGAPLKY